ncbi:MAG: metallophosphoesterase [Desulfurococcales archaeon]|nr:metallophosphoesterase [Desulfurococcales archaeon]
MARISRRRFLALAGATILGLATHGSIGAYTIEVERIHLGLGRKILFAPDIHTHGGDRDELVQLASRERPDIIILGGDLWDRLTPSLTVVEGLVAALKQQAGALVYTPGNHEHWIDSRGTISLREALQTLESLGVETLLDDKTTVKGLLVAALDWRDNPANYREPAHRIGEADITVAHSPDAFPHLHPRQHLLLAGHTHGGQLCLPRGRPIKTNSIYGYTWGVYKTPERTMLLSRGAGEMIPPRIYCSRHVYILT